MREQRRASQGWAAVAIIALVALAAPAAAQPGQADLLVRGTLALDGRTSVVANDGWLLLRDPGNELYDQVAISLNAVGAELVVHRVSEVCAGSGMHTGAFVPLPDGVRLSRLGEAQGLVADVLAAPLPAALALPAQAQAQAGAAAGEALGAADEALVLRAAPAAPVPLPPTPVGPACLTPGLREETETFRLRDLALSASGSTDQYVLYWVPENNAETWGRYGYAPPPSPAQAGLDASAVILQADAATMEFQEHDERVYLVPDNAWSSYGPRETLRGDAVRADAEAARGSFTGAGRLFVFAAQAVASAVDEETNEPFTQTYDTGERREGGVNGERRVIEYLEVRLTGASGSFESAAPVRAQAGWFMTNLDGELSIPHATGTLQAADQEQTFDDATAVLAGAFAYSLRGPDADEDGREAVRKNMMALDAQGDFRVEGAGPAPQPQQAVAGTAAAVSAVALTAGALAYFWPALKWLLAPLYTRIPKDTLLVHDARERIFRLIKEEPGIHAHEVASRLDLGWGTAVYHLKLLERNGLVVARHEGRYKRFFVTGDQRIQHKEAVSLLRNATSRSIAVQVATQPGLIQKQVCEALGLSPSLASWHLQRLEQAGVVRAERLGRAVRYMPGPAWVELQELGAAARPAGTAPTAPPASPPVSAPGAA